MDDYKTIGARIRQARIAKGLTQVELAVAIGVSRAHLTNAEGGNGGLALDKLSSLASETGTTVAWLIGEATSPPAPTDPTLKRIFVAFNRIDLRDREKLARIAESFLDDDLPDASPEGADPPRPFVEGGYGKENPVSGDCKRVVRWPGEYTNRIQST